MFYLGILLLLVAFIATLWNLHESYVTQAGALGQVPVFGSTIIQIPLLVMLGLKLIDSSGWLHLEWWHYLEICLALVVCLGSLVAWIGRYAESKNKGSL